MQIGFFQSRIESQKFSLKRIRIDSIRLRTRYSHTSTTTSPHPVFSITPAPADRRGKKTREEGTSLDFPGGTACGRARTVVSTSTRPPLRAFSPGGFRPRFLESPCRIAPPRPGPRHRGGASGEVYAAFPRRVQFDQTTIPLPDRVGADPPPLPPGVDPEAPRGENEATPRKGEGGPPRVPGR